MAQHIVIHNIVNGVDTNNLYFRTHASDVVINPFTNGLSTYNDLQTLLSNLGSLAFEDYVALNVASSSNYGIVRVQDVNTNSSDSVPSSKALYDTAATKVNNTGNEEIAGEKDFTAGLITGGLRITRNAATHVTTLEIVSNGSITTTVTLDGDSVLMEEGKYYHLNSNAALYYYDGTHVSYAVTNIDTTENEITMLGNVQAAASGTYYYLYEDDEMYLFDGTDFVLQTETPAEPEPEPEGE